MTAPWEPDRYYHIYNHANGNDNLFIDEDNYRWFLKQFDRYISPLAETYAYCLMPNHFHFFIRLKNLLELTEDNSSGNAIQESNFSEVISRKFSNFFSSYTQGYNRMYSRKGSLFLKNIKRTPVLSDEYFTRLTGYIHLNPVLHGFVRYVADWKWSSYLTILSSLPTKLNRKLVLDWFGGPDRFKEYHRQYLSEKENRDFIAEFSRLARP